MRSFCAARAAAHRDGVEQASRAGALRPRREPLRSPARTRRAETLQALRAVLALRALNARRRFETDGHIRCEATTSDAAYAGPRSGRGPPAAPNVTSRRRVRGNDTMKRTMWRVGPTLCALASLPLACGGEPAGARGQGGEVGAARGAWSIDLVDSATTADCTTELLFEVSAAETIDFIAIEASEELSDDMELSLFTIDETERLRRVEIAALRASTLVEEASAMARTANRTSESAAAAASANERSVVDSRSFTSTRSEAITESTASRSASASMATSIENDLLEENETIVDHEASAAAFASEEVAASAAELLFGWGFGLLGGARSATSFEAAESVEAVAAAEKLDIRYLDRDRVQSSSSETASANEAMAETVFDRKLVANEQIADHRETIVKEAAESSVQSAEAFSESIVETAESVYEALEQTEALSQSALDRTSVLLTESLESRRLLVQVRFSSAIREAVERAESELQTANVQVLTGTVGGVAASALFPQVLACTLP